MASPIALRTLPKDDTAAFAALRAFARALIFERIWLHGALEVPPLFARSEIVEARHGSHVVGALAVIEKLFPFRLAAVDGALPGVVEALLREVPRPFVCPAPARLAHEIARAGGREIRTELQMARLDDGVPLPAPDARVERLTDADELVHFCGTSFARIELALAPFFGVRDAKGELAAVAGARFTTAKIALIAHLETREDCRRQGYARALAIAALHELARGECRAVLQLKEGEHAGRRLFAALGFRGTREFRVYAF
jgi:hypothetical protein